MVTTILFFGGPPATMNNVIEWLERLVTTSGITAWMCIYPTVDSIPAIFSMVPQNGVNKSQLNCAYMSILVVAVKTTIRKEDFSQ